MESQERCAPLGENVVCRSLHNAPEFRCGTVNNAAGAQ